MIQVWAPKAKTLDIALNGKRIPMQRSGSLSERRSKSLSERRSELRGSNRKLEQCEEKGWWNSGDIAIAPGLDYAFYINGEGPFPDPRSPWQPEGVHGPSRTIDHSTFRWMDERWQQPPLASAVIYEIHIGTFTPQGTFDSAISHLDHLVDLGVTHVEFMPIAEFPGSRGWGYDGVSLYAPHHSYGGPDGLKRLVNACHEKGLAVIQDVVYNHLGPIGSYIEKFAEYLSEKYSTAWGKSINTDSAGSIEARRFFIDNALMWLRDYHFDALRLDAADNLFDSSAVHFLEQLTTEVHALACETGRHLYVTAETNPNDPRFVRPPEMGGFGIDAQWLDDFHHAVRVTLTGENSGYYVDYRPFSDLAKSLRDAYVYDGQYFQHQQIHRGRPAGSLSGHQFICFCQNHDQIGNRAQGERIGHEVSMGRQKIMASILLTSPYIPLIFQGQDWGASTPFQFFLESDDETFAESVRHGRCNEFAAFGWKPEEIPDPTSGKTFLNSKLKWDEVNKGQHMELLEWYRRLVEFRRTIPALRDGRRDNVHVEYSEKSKWMLIRRGSIVIAFSISDRDQHIRISWKESSVGILLSSDPSIEITPEGAILPPDSVILLSS